MPGKFLFWLIICVFLSVTVIFAQEEYDIQADEQIDSFDDFLQTENITESINEAEPGIKNDFWICLGADTAMYSYLGLAFGPSFAFGYGSGSSFGLKVTMYFNEEGIDTLELCLIIRFYMFGADAYSGPFIQVLGGPSLYNRTGSFIIPSNTGMISAGLSFGWRFIFYDRFYVEPAIRGGYPYLFGATVSAGIRF